MVGVMFQEHSNWFVERTPKLERLSMGKTFQGEGRVNMFEAKKINWGGGGGYARTAT